MIVEKSATQQCFNIDTIGHMVDDNQANDPSTNPKLLKKISVLAKVVGLDGLRMSFLYDGNKISSQSLPKIDIFYEHKYKRFQVPNTKASKLERIIKYNCTDQENEGCSLFCLKSFINHNRKPNVEVKYVSQNLVFVYAKEDISKGTELLIDYCPHLEEMNKRNKVLAKYDIIEQPLPIV